MFRKGSKLMQQLAGDWTPSLYYGLFDDNGDGGVEGGGEAEGQQQTERTVEGEEREEGGRVAGDKGVNGHMIPKSRFDEINRQLAAYRQFGDPAAIKALKDRVAWMEQNPGKKFNEKQEKEIESELRAIPALRRALEVAERYEIQEQRQAKRFTDYGGRLTDKFLGELGRTPDDRNRAALSHAIAGVIQSDKDLLDRFFAFDNDVYADAFKQFKQQILGNAPLKREVPGAAVQRLKQTPKPGQKQDKKPPEKPQHEKTDRDILDEANEAAYETLLAAAESE